MNLMSLSVLLIFWVLFFPFFSFFDEQVLVPTPPQSSVRAGFTIHHSWTLMILEGLHRPAHRSLLTVGPLDLGRKDITAHMEG